MSRLIFISVALLILVVAPTYVSARLTGVMPWTRRQKMLGWFLIELLIVPVLPLMFLSRTRSGALIDAALGASHLGLALFCFLFFWTVVRDLVWLPARFTVLRDRAQRRKWLPRSSMVVGAVSVLSLLVGVAQALLPPGVTRVEVPIVNLHPDLDGYRIAHLSDIHLSPWKDGDDLRRIVERTNATEADLVVITGDFVDGSVAERGDDALPLADLGAPAFFVTGNHEYYSGVTEWTRHLDGLGVQTLDGEKRLIAQGDASLLVAGLADPTASDSIRERNFAALANGGSDAGFRLLLAHRPADAYEVEGMGFDLQLSGHTHNGQFFPFTLLIDFFQPFAYGLHRHDGMWIYTSRGAGFWGPPVRFLNPPEIVVLTLRRE